MQHRSSSTGATSFIEPLRTSIPRLTPGHSDIEEQRRADAQRFRAASPATASPHAADGTAIGSADANEEERAGPVEHWWDWMPEHRLVPHEFVEVYIHATNPYARKRMRIRA